MPPILVDSLQTERALHHRPPALDDNGLASNNLAHVGQIVKRFRTTFALSSRAMQTGYQC